MVAEALRAGYLFRLEIVSSRHAYEVAGRQLVPVVSVGYEGARDPKGSKGDN